jgi:O-methyltransferase
MKSLLRSVLPKPLVTLLRGRRQGLRFLTTSHPKLNLADKMRILGRFEDVNRAVRAEHSENEILEVVNHLLEVDKKGPRDAAIVECGTFKGASSCKLSIVAKQIGRQLYCYDSFAGLPETAEYRGNQGRGVVFRQGDYASDYDVFMQKLAAVGEPSVTTVKKGWFSDTLPGFPHPIQLMLIDVDLVSSTKDCFRELWPRVVPGGMFFSHDGHVDEIAEMFETEEFWRETCNSPRPRMSGLTKEKLVFGYK